MLAAQAIDLASDCLKVIGVYAPSVSTEVIEIKPFGDWPFVQFVTSPMGQDMSITGGTTAKLPVTILTGACCPLPATVRLLLYLGEKTIHQRRGLLGGIGALSGAKPGSPVFHFA